MVKEYKAVPAWATSVILNYKEMFKKKYARQTKLSDEQVFYIFNTIFNDYGSSLEDQERVEAMIDMECGRYE